MRKTTLYCGKPWQIELDLHPTLEAEIYFPIIKFSPTQPYSVQMLNLGKITFADGKVFSLISFNKLYRLHLLCLSIWVLWTLGEQNPCDNFTWMRYCTSWLASLTDHCFWDRGLLLLTPPPSRFALPPLQDAFSCPSPPSNSGGKGEHLAALFWLRWAVRLNQVTLSSA